MKLSKTYNLKAVNPGLSAQWHPLKNGDLKPEDVTPGSHKKVWWICAKGHEWQTLVKDRNSNHGCPYCSGKRVSKDNCLKTKNPSLSRQWHPVKNGDLTPEDVTSGSEKKVWWLCTKGHEWQEKVYLQDRSRGCPFCHKENPDKKFTNRSVSARFRGFYKPILIEHSDGNSTFLKDVHTTLEEKKDKRIKGKIIKKRKMTTYARYVYGLDRIPEGWVIWHIDGDPLNNNIENLECISRDEQLRRIKMIRYNKNP